MRRHGRTERRLAPALPRPCADGQGGSFRSSVFPGREAWDASRCRFSLLPPCGEPVEPPPFLPNGKQGKVQQRRHQTAQDDVGVICRFFGKRAFVRKIAAQQPRQNVGSRRTSDLAERHGIENEIDCPTGKTFADLLHQQQVGRTGKDEAIFPRIAIHGDFDRLKQFGRFLHFV